MTTSPIPMDDEDLCTTCHKPRSNHPYRHAFTSRFNGGRIRPVEDVALPNDASSKPAPKSQGLNQAPLAGDPVLRIALIRAGVITPELLDQVEHELRTAGIAYAVVPSPPLG